MLDLKAWKSVNQQRSVDIQTLHAALVMRAPAQARARSAVKPGELFSSLSAASGTPTLSVTTMVVRPAELGASLAPVGGLLRVPSAVPVLGLTVPIATEATGPAPRDKHEAVVHKPLDTALETDQSDLCTPLFEILGQPTLCSSAGPFRLTGPAWLGTLEFEIDRRSDAPRLVVRRTGETGEDPQPERRVELEQEALVWIQPCRTLEPGEPISLVSIRLNG